MKFIIFTDPHWSSESSILRSHGEKYSTRLENLIESTNWVESLAMWIKADGVICLGDFWDKSVITAEESAAINEVQWNPLPHIFIVGNHEMGRHDLSLSTTHLFNMRENFTVIDTPQIMNIGDSTEFLFLPYILDSTNYSISEHFEKPVKKRIILSHNDIKGIQMGAFTSTAGLDMKDIEDNCNLFINGHLHNGEKITSKIINLGNLTGQNFGEDGEKYKHRIIILDTDTETIEYMENPYALKFYKLTYPCSKSFDKYSIASISTDEQYKNDALKWAEQFLASRVTVNYKTVQISESAAFERQDEFEQFEKYVFENIGDSEIIREELSLLKGGENS